MPTPTVVPQENGSRPGFSEILKEYKDPLISVDVSGRFLGRIIIEAWDNNSDGSDIKVAYVWDRQLPDGVNPGELLVLVAKDMGRAGENLSKVWDELPNQE
ncbi:MAG TPA: hypothetical protein ENJ93_01385 [Chloroflexi bacterium]|nr:hypothetical protein [Chloroflexota bacterium]